MAEPVLIEITPWLERVSRAKTQKQIYEILDQFRTLGWTDDQRSTMAKLYMRLIANLPSGESSTAGGGGT